MADGEQYLKSPRQASKIYDLNGTRGPRPRNLFVVNFRKAGDTTTATSGTTSGTWNKDLGFVVKSVDRPSIDPKVEELNQYGKKRLIQTGYKLGPTRIVFYDTADSMVMKMFAEYAKYFYGDFRHTAASTGTTSTDWQYNVTLNEFKGASQGFGFNPQGGSTTETDFNAQFFFDSISVYQVFGKKYVKFDLINPKITAFDPDEMDYSISEIATITMTVQAEAILFTNDYQPQDLSGESFLSQAFGTSSTGSFNGEVLDLPANSATNPVTSVSQPTVGGSLLNDVLTPTPSVMAPYVGAPVAQYPASTGALSTYGNYNFGTAYGGRTGSTLTSDLSTLAVTNPRLATALGLTSSVGAGRGRLYASPLQTPYVSPASISQSTLDQARAAVDAAGLNYGRYDATYNGDLVAYAAIASGLADGQTPREQVYNRRVPEPSVAPYTPQSKGTVRPYDQSLVDQGLLGRPMGTPSTMPPNSWSSADDRGIALTPGTYGAINAQTSGTTQIGFNERTTTARTPTQPYGTGMVRPRPIP